MDELDADTVPHVAVSTQRLAVCSSRMSGPQITEIVNRNESVVNQFSLVPANRAWSCMHSTQRKVIYYRF